MIFVGTAGWPVGTGNADLLPEAPSNLARHGLGLTATEVNSSFYRPHRPQTWARWAESVPEGFRFSAKVPKTVSHDSRLRDLAPLDAFFAEVDELGEKLGPLLLQLPPSLAFDEGTARAALERLRAEHAVVVEPRHPSWFSEPADALLRELRVPRVAADPAPVPEVVSEAQAPGGDPSFRYWRLHGSPDMYYSAYDEAFLSELAEEVEDGDWVIFDNTASGQALKNAVRLLELLGMRKP